MAYDTSDNMEEQLTHLRQQIETAEAELIEREAELVDLRTETYAFRLEYDTRLGRKVIELDKIETEIKRCQQRIDEYHEWGPDGPPYTLDGTPYASVEEQYRHAWQQPETSPPPPPPPVKPVNAATDAQIKKLYRQLCRRFHPDLAQDASERVWRTEIMTTINAAYAARSLVELQALAERPDRSPSVESDTDEQRLTALRDKLQQVERRLQEVEQETHDLMNSPEIDLRLDVKLAQRQGRDLLAEMAAEVERELERKRVELDLALAYMRELGITS
ncbi:MAG: hypothetical protein GY832_00285 [Chloroflexi bacterium]|nr:hypothetical protein [Chloroflexota bacterium]